MAWLFWNGTDLNPMPEDGLSIACSNDNSSGVGSSSTTATTPGLVQNSTNSNLIEETTPGMTNEATISSTTATESEEPSSPGAPSALFFCKSLYRK